MAHHTESDEGFNRRRFLRCSAAAAAAFAFHRGVDPDSETVLAAQRFEDPSLDYPWNVAVGNRGRILLCLLDEASDLDDIRKLTFDRPVYSILKGLLNAVDKAWRNHVEFENELAELNVNTDELKKRLKVARTALRKEGIKHWRYRDFAVRDPENWGKGLAVPSALETLSALDEVITFPPLRCTRETAQEFYARWDSKTVDATSSFRDAFAHGVNGDHWSGKRTLAAALQDGRQSGIFWCYPAAERVSGGQQNPFVEEEEGEQYQTCVGGDCTVTGDPNDYCQMVDGSCNPMSGGG